MPPCGLRAIGEQQLANAMASLPSEHRHILQVDNGDNRRARRRWKTFRRWFTANGTCSEKLIPADFFFCLVELHGQTGRHHRRRHTIVR